MHIAAYTSNLSAYCRLHTSKIRTQIATETSKSFSGFQENLEISPCFVKNIRISILQKKLTYIVQKYKSSNGGYKVEWKSPAAKLKWKNKNKTLYFYRYCPEPELLQIIVYHRQSSHKRALTLYIKGCHILTISELLIFKYLSFD